MTRSCTILAAALVAGNVCAGLIDRHELVTRHNIDWPDATAQIPLGNGEFCFTADGTGLQTFGGNAMAHWGWHSFPLPAGWTPDRVPASGTFQVGRNRGEDKFPEGTGPLWRWMFDNPHVANLGRLRLVRSGGAPITPGDIEELQRSLDLWSGIQTASYKLDGEPVRVETCVHPEADAVAVRIESPLLASGKLAVELDFPYPSITNNPSVGDFARVDGHTTKVVRVDDRGAEFHRRADDLIYQAQLVWDAGEIAPAAASAGSPHRFRMTSAGKERLDFLCAYFSTNRSSRLPTIGNVFVETSNHWKQFWTTGGAIDLSRSRDPRWRELERRIVLSQYLMAAQSAGSWPSSEAGLMAIDPWRGQFHMEMVWWHLAHYALWDRWEMADEALGCYRRFMPQARALAQQLDYAGLKWPKSVGPEGRSAPWEGNQVLLWKQPHPIFFAELEYRLKPTPGTLRKWADIIDGTAAHMADYVTRDPTNGICSLVPVMPPSELGVTRDTVFDLAYWRWGLDAAQRWRERMGQPRVAAWDEVRRNLAPLPVADGLFLRSVEWTNTYTHRIWEHPDPVGVLGMLPPIDGVDAETARRTVQKVWTTWNWSRCWGWDFPWIAMAAARTGDPQLAVDALLKDSPRNIYDTRGVNTGGPCPYLPGNGGLLYAVAMMAAGWDGAPDRPVPGFPDDGSWVVQWEGLQRAP